MKTLKKSLAIFLSVLMALSMCSLLGTVAFAVDAPDGYVILPTSADDLYPGDWYFDLSGYVAALRDAGYNDDADRYEATEFFIKEDHSAIKIFNQNYYDQSRPDPFENYTSDTSIFESFVLQYGFGPWETLHLIDTWDDVAGLLVGWYYTYKTVFADFYDDGDYIEVYTDEFWNFKIVVNGVVTVIENGEATEAFEAAIMQRDTDTAWTQLPLSPDGLNYGDKYFDKAAVLEETEITDEEFATYFFDKLYIDEDGNFKMTCTNVYGEGPDDFIVFDTIVGMFANAEDWADINGYVKQVTFEDLGYVLLPKSAEGLADGTLWLNAEGYCSYLADHGYTEANAAQVVDLDYYLDPATSTIYCDENGYVETSPLGSYGLWNFILCAGFQKLPYNLTVDTPRAIDSEFAYENFSRYDSETGETVYDDEFDVYNVYDAFYYLSEDEDTIIAITKEGKKEFDRATNLYHIFDYIKINPLEGATVLPVSDEGLVDGDAWLDIETYISNMGGYMEPDTFAYFEQLVRGAVWYLAADGETVFGVDPSGRILEYDLDHYLKIVGYDPYAGLVPIVYDLAEIEEIGIYLEKEPFYAYFLEAVGVPEEEAEEFMNEIEMYSFYYNPENGEISMAIEQYGYIEAYSIDELQDALDEINEALALAEEGSEEYDELMSQKDEVNQILSIITYIRDNMLIIEAREQEEGEEAPEESVVIYAAPNVIDEDALLVVVPDVEVRPELHQAIRNLPELDKKKILQQSAYDVKLMKDDVAIQPDGSITLRFPAPENAAPEKVGVYHALANGTVEKVPSRVRGNYVYADADGLSIYLVAAIDDCAHENMTATAAKAATCKAEGNSAYWYCPDCEAYFFDAAGETEIEAESWVLPIDETAHTAAAAVEENRNEATCTATGSYDSVVYCADCGEELNRTANTIAKKSHAMGDWTVTKEATCTEEGVKSRSCGVCGFTETKPIDKTAHNYADGVCTVCGAEQPKTGRDNFWDALIAFVTAIVRTLTMVIKFWK